MSAVGSAKTTLLHVTGSLDGSTALVQPT